MNIVPLTGRTLGWIACLFLTASGCDEPAPVADLDHVERLVVWGVVEEGSTRLTVQVGRTTSLAEPHSAVTASIADAQVVVWVDGVPVSPAHDTLGRYVLSGELFSAGTTLDLRVTWKNLVARATTVVPETSTVLDVAYSEGRLQTRVKASRDHAYSLSWELRTATGTAESGLFTHVVAGTDADSSGVLVLNEEPGIAPSASDTLYAIVDAYDIAFFQYFITRGGNAAAQSSGLDRGNSGFVSWNVEGDGIGLFVGKATREVAVQRE